MNNIQTLTDPNAIKAFRLLALRTMLSIETKGMTGKVAAGPLIRASTGLTARNKKVLLREFNQWLEDQGIRDKKDGE